MYRSYDVTQQRQIQVSPIFQRVPVEKKLNPPLPFRISSLCVYLYRSPATSAQASKYCVIRYILREDVRSGTTNEPG